MKWLQKAASGWIWIYSESVSKKYVYENVLLRWITNLALWPIRIPGCEISPSDGFHVQRTAEKITNMHPYPERDPVRKKSQTIGPHIQCPADVKLQRSHEDVWGSGGIALCILSFGTTWKWVVSLTPRPLCSRGNSMWHPFDRRLGGPQGQSGRCIKKKKNRCPCRESNPDRPARSLVTVLIEL
jgi:hypothetical protein